MNKRTAASGILSAVHEAARDLHEGRTIGAVTMRRFDVLCLPPVRTYSPEDIQRIRNEANVSQAVFAAVLNVGKATVAAWEQGSKVPSGPALKLLELVERKGLSVLG